MATTAPKYDMVLATVAKERSASVKADAVRWNVSQHIFEYWNGSTWTDVSTTNTSVVHLSGTESITGSKTFTQSVSIQSTSADVTGSNANAYRDLQFLDKNGSRIGVLRAYDVSSSNERFVTLNVVKKDNTSPSGIGVHIDDNDNVWTHAPTPGTDDNSSKIATTEYVKSNLSSYALSGHTHSYLPLSGGTLTGAIKFVCGDGKVLGSTDDNYLKINGGSTSNGASQLILAGSTYTGNLGKGGWVLRAKGIVGTATEATTKDLVGKPDGTLTWGGTAVSLDGHTHSYLPLSGGTLTGNLVLGRYITTANDTSSTAFYGDTGNGVVGPAVIMFGRARTSDAGIIKMRAGDGTNVSNLRLFPNGDLTWNGMDVEIVDSSGSGWIRYSNGIQVCWGRSKGATESGGSTWTLPKAFKDTNFRVIGTACGSDNKNGVVFNTISTTTSTVVFKCIAIYDGNTSHAYSGVYAHYLAIGYWK